MHSYNEKSQLDEILHADEMSKVNWFCNVINLMIGGNVTEKITPETYEKMNEEFIEEGLSFRIIVPTQEQIDNWIERSNDAN